MVRNYGENGFTAFTATTDACRPVLVEVRTGQEAHNPTQVTQQPYDAHNFIEFKWSEPVTITGLGDAVYAKSAATTNGITTWGGAITTGAGLTIADYATIAAGNLATGSRGTFAGPHTYTANDETVHALYRTFSLDGSTFGPQPHRLRISIAGWSEDILVASGNTMHWFFQGFIDGSTLPSGAVTAVANANILDQAVTPNQLEPTADPYAKAAITVNSVPDPLRPLYGVWDTTPPDLAGLKSIGDPWVGTPEYFEALPVANPSGLISFLEMHFFDNKVDYTNAAEVYKWRSKIGWHDTTYASLYDAAPEEFGGSRPLYNAVTNPIPTSGGIRDSSLYFTQNAFTLTPSEGAPAGVASFLTTVNSPFMSPLGTPSGYDDPYFRLQIPSSWPIANTTLTVSYNRTVSGTETGFVTDLAGNRLSNFSLAKCLDRTPPQITFTLAGVGRNELFVLFSKKLELTTPDYWLGIGITLADGSVIYPTGTADIDDPSNIRSLLYTLPLNITASDIISASTGITVTPSGLTNIDPDTGISGPVSHFHDVLDNFIDIGATHQLTNLGIGLVDVLYGSDGVNTDGLLGINEGALRAFDGTGRLLDRDIIIGSRINTDASVPASKPLTMYFDVNPPNIFTPSDYNLATGSSLMLWLPSVIPSFNALGNQDARAVSPIKIVDTNRLFRNFLIPEADVEVIPGSSIEMVFQYGDLYCVRLTDPLDITSVSPWSFNISETKLQRGGVTILNNVIDSNKHEKTIIQVEVPKAGNIVIQVFTMDGNLVKVLERSRKGGGNYSYYWDGSNGAGTPVARGMYFIRVVGPDMDEIRKVMVVKE